MGVSIAYGAVPVQKSFQANSVSFGRSVGERGTATVRHINSEYEPSAGEELRIYIDANLIWGGKVVSVRKSRLGSTGSTSRYIDVDATSWEAVFDQRVITAQAYSGMNAGDTVQQAVTDYGAGENITFGTIEDGASAAELGNLVYKLQTLSEVLDDLATRSNYYWYITPAKALTFVKKSLVTNSGLVISNANENFRDPSITDQTRDYYNKASTSVEFSAVSYTDCDTIIADGINRTFTLEVSGVTIDPVDHIVQLLVNGVPQDFGTEGSGATWTYKPGGTQITQDPAATIIESGIPIDVRVYKIGDEMLVEEDATDIAARSAAEGGTGIYHAILPPDIGLDYDSAREKLKKFLDKHCPRRVGAASGTLPAEYEWESDSYITDAHLLVPGSLVTFNNTNPSTGGNLSILIQSISASAISVADPLGFGEGTWPAASR